MSDDLYNTGRLEFSFPDEKSARMAFDVLRHLSRGARPGLIVVHADRDEQDRSAISLESTNVSRTQLLITTVLLVQAAIEDLTSCPRRENHVAEVEALTLVRRQIQQIGGLAEGDIVSAALRGLEALH